MPVLYNNATKGPGCGVAVGGHTLPDLRAHRTLARTRVAACCVHARETAFAAAIGYSGS